MITIKLLVILVCGSYLMFNIIGNGLVTTSVSSIQNRYSLKSVDVGTIMAMMDIGSLVLLIVIALAGENINKPKWLCVNTVIVGVGAIVFALPHFTAPTYVYDNSSYVNYCGNVTRVNCEESSLRLYIIVFIVGTLLMGAGLASIFTHGITYIDDNATTRQSSFYTSIFYGMSSCGAFIGFIFGGTLTELFVDPTRNVEISSSHPNWIGAWWPGYIICGAITILVAFTFIKMPMKIEGTINAENLPSANASRLNWMERCKSLVRNPLYILATIVIGLSNAFVIGFNAFGVKYTESQYGLTTFKASLVYGITAVISVTLGHVGSGAIMAKYDLKVKGIIKLCLVTTFISVIFTFGFFFYCSDDQFAGATVPYTDSYNLTITGLTSECNEDCGCSRDWYKPVRGSDDIVYYSPCYAGCGLDHENGTYSECSCIVYAHNNSSYDYHAAVEISTLSGGYCSMLVAFATIMGFTFLTSVMTISPTTQLTIRSVADAEKSSAISIQQIVALLIGNIPGRVLTGKVLDAACLTWSTKCGIQSSCKVYKKWDLAFYMFLLLEVEAILLFALYLAIYFVNNRSQESKSKDVVGNVNPSFEHSEPVSRRTVAQH